MENQAKYTLGLHFGLVGQSLMATSALCMICACLMLQIKKGKPLLEDHALLVKNADIDMPLEYICQ